MQVSLIHELSENKVKKALIYVNSILYLFVFFKTIIMLAYTYLTIIVLETGPSCHAKELWVEKYKPQSLSDLAVHKKKVLLY